MSSGLNRRKLFRYGSLFAAATAFSACSAQEHQDTTTPHTNDTSTSPTPTKHQPVTLRFANAAPTSSLDVATSGTLETARISAQVLEPLLRANVDTGLPEASLATKWDVSSDRLSYTFTLRNNVTFHDGTPFNADAVLKNYQRWVHAAADTTAYSHTDYLQLFSGVTAPDQRTPLVTDCKAVDEKVIFTLSRPSTSFIKALTQPAFGIASPASLNDEYHFKKLPVGTGAYTLKEWDGSTATLEASPTYWGTAPVIERLIISTISDSDKRYYALRNGDIDAYDLVAIDNYVPLARSGNLIQPRDPYAICYISINTDHPVLSKALMRQAIAHALDRHEVVRNNFPQGTNVANDFLPALFMMKNDDTRAYYNYDKNRAKEQLEASGYNGEELTFYYPTGVSLATMESPEAIYASLAANLVSIGLNIKPMPVPWNEGYLDVISQHSTERALALTGFVGSYRDPNAFISRVLAPTSEIVHSAEHSEATYIENGELEILEEPAPDNHKLDAPTDEQPKDDTEAPTTEKDDAPAPDSTSLAELPREKITYPQILSAMRAADQINDVDKRRIAYQAINLHIALLMPAIPIAYPISSVALGPRVDYYPLSATGIANFASAKAHS
ncbi:ABC transporter substrate-binding protein [Rothia sp. P7208]|uniref:ABC transporter substrate-binding protein n=1 Tax=Rothia sp. P7208 TaxID=3402660 RepID=UPI003ACBCCC6